MAVVLLAMTIMVAATTDAAHPVLPVATVATEITATALLHLVVAMKTNTHVDLLVAHLEATMTIAVEDLLMTITPLLLAAVTKMITNVDPLEAEAMALVVHQGMRMVEVMLIPMVVAEVVMIEVPRLVVEVVLEGIGVLVLLVAASMVVARAMVVIAGEVVAEVAVVDVIEFQENGA